MAAISHQTPAFTYDLRSADASQFSRGLFLYEKFSYRLISGLPRLHKVASHAVAVPAALTMLKAEGPVHFLGKSNVLRIC
jgi:hypothetical protein